MQDLGLNRAINLVGQFHKRVGAHVSDQPRLLVCEAANVRELTAALLELQERVRRLAEEHPQDELTARMALVLEELSEWLAAQVQGDLVAAADAWADRMYVLLGDAVISGLPAEELFQEVHSSNMTKCADALRTGKAIKGAAYRPPDIRRILKLARLAR